jgi:hypothetical protein
LKINSSWADFSEYKEIIEENKKFVKFKKNSLSSPKGEGLGVRFVNSIFKKIFLPKTLKHYKKI